MRLLLHMPHQYIGAFTEIDREAPALLALFCAASAYLGSQGCYRERLPFWSELRLFALVSVFAVLADSFVDIAIKERPSRVMLVTGLMLFTPFVGLIRPLAKRLLSAAGLWQLPVLVIGDPAGVAGTIEVLGSEGVPGYRVAGSCEPFEAIALSRNEGWASLLQRNGCRRVALALRFGTPEESALLQSLMRAGVSFAVLPQFDVLPVVGCERIPFFSHDTVMLSYRNNLSHGPARLAKACFDLLAAALLLLLSAPVFLLLMLLVRSDGGPAFFVHRRIGARGRRFGCLKFRTMTPNAEQVLQRSLDEDPALALEWANTRKLRRDPRVTRLGHFLRATSLDELPQLINVLMLQMSLVGPRPIVEQEVARYGEDIAFYYGTRPGITGLWQVSGRADTSYERRVKLDAWYVKNWTVWHDVAILSKTVPAVLLRRGAH